MPPRSPRKRQIVAATALSFVLALTACVATPRVEHTPRAVPSVTPTVPEGPVDEAESAEHLNVLAISESERNVARSTPYAYAPTALLDRGRIGLWWCGVVTDPPGDDIAHGTSDAVDGPFVGEPGTTPTSAITGTGAAGDFDSMHTCDPNVIRVDETYYLYYTGSFGGNSDWGRNQVGLATSTDGETWVRQNGGRSILTQAAVIDRGDESYGAGQPAVAYRDGWFYVLMTDTSAEGSEPPRGQGQFLQRSKDPAFSRGVQILTEEGFVRTSTPSSPRSYSLIRAFSTDFAWFQQLNAWGVTHQIPGGTQVTFFSEDFSEQPYEPIVLPGDWKEGSGLLRTFDGRMPVSETRPCETLPVTIYRSTKETDAGTPTALRRASAVVTGFDACTNVQDTLELLEGSAIPAEGDGPEMDLVADGELIRLPNAALARKIAVQVIRERPTILDGVSPEVEVGRGYRLVSNGSDVGILTAGKILRIRHGDQLAFPPADAPGPIAEETWSRLLDQNVIG